MEIFTIIFISLIMASMTALYFFVGYKFLKKYKGKKNGDN
jgi:hypothetical protein